MVAAVEPDRVRVGGDGVIIALLLERGVAAFFCGVRSLGHGSRAAEHSKNGGCQVQNGPRAQQLCLLLQVPLL